VVGSVLGAALAVGACRSPDPANSAESRREVRAAMEAFTDALRGAPPNGDSLVGFFAPNGEILEPALVPLRGDRIREFLSAFGDLVVDEATLKIDTIETDGRIAIVWGWFTRRNVVPGQPPIEARGRAVYQWTKMEDGRWRIVRTMTQPVTPPPMPPS